MRTKIFTAALLTLGILMVPALIAQENQQKDQQQKDKAIHRASNLTGLNVYNGPGDDAQHLGNIDDMVIDLRTGNVVYYVLARGQVLGLGGQRFAIAPEALKRTPRNQTDIFVLEGVTNKQLDDAKGFDTNAYPHEPDRKWGKAAKGPVEKAGEAAKQAGKDVKEAVKGKPQLGRVNSIFNMAVRNQANENLGSIFDLAMHLNANEHKVAYVAVSHGGALGVGGKLHAVPLEKFEIESPQLRPGERVFILNITPNQLEQSPGFVSTDPWPARPDEQFWGKIKTLERDQPEKDRPDNN